jgi:DNA primase
MAIIPNEDINKIRSNANIVDIVSSYINLEAKGKNYFGVCPFHDDHSPSLCVSNEKQIYTCFVCGNSGNVFTFVQNYENVDFVNAVKIVADKIGYNLNVDPKVNNPNKKYYDLVELANKYFINNLNSGLGSKAKEYLINERKLTENDIEEFKIGLALNDNNLNKVLSSKGYTENEIVSLSLANKTDNGLLDLFRNRITFPINDDKGNVVAFSARIFNGEDGSKYINSKESTIFKKGNILFNYDKCKNAVNKTKSVILCEGSFDAIRIYSSGFENVCASMGTALTNEHIKLLKRLNAKVILMMDNDSAGEKSTLANGEALINANIETLVVRLSGEKDPDSYILKYGAEAFKENLNNATSFFDFKVNYLKKNKNLTKSDELALYINEVIDELNKSDDEILKALTINKLASDYNLDKSVLEARLIKNKEVKINIKPIKVKKKIGKYEKTAQTILYIMMNNPDYIKKFQRELNYFPDKTYKNIANDIIAFKQINGEFDLADFITYVNDFSYKDLILEIINSYQNSENLEIDFENYLSIIREWVQERQIEKIKTELKNETDIKRKEELNDLIIQIKRGSEE